ncbi:MAG: glycosyltransferase family 4 protein [Rhodoluna sp.]
MSIFFDCRYIRVDHHDGISRFSAGLFAELQKRMDVTAIISDHRQLDKLPKGSKFVKLNDPTSLLEPLLALKLNRLGATKVFSPMQTMGTFGRKFKLILTLHDLIYYRHPAPPPAFNLFIRILWRIFHLTYIPQRLLLNRADRIVTVSETTKSLMIRHRLTKKPIDVIHNAADPSEVHLPQAPQSRKLVYMGSFMNYKDVELLIVGMQELPNYELRLLSRISQERRSELEKLTSSSLDRVIFVNGVSDDEYQQELLEAFCLVHASKDEGFGIPLVEAMVRGLPIVISDIEIFKEIGGEAATFFAAGDVAGFVAAVKSLEDPQTWTNKSIQAQKRALEFSWEKSSIDLMGLLTNL